MSICKNTLPIQANYDADDKKGGALTILRKAELFDRIMESTRENEPEGCWYDLLLEIGMDEGEMRAAGLNLPELSITQGAVKDMVDLIISEVKKTKMEGQQIYIELSVSKLVARSGFGLGSCTLANDMFYEEIATRKEISDTEIQYDRLLVRPVPDLIDRLHCLEPSGQQMEE
jgi:hypothetical protein